MKLSSKIGFVIIGIDPRIRLAMLMIITILIDIIKVITHSNSPVWIWKVRGILHQYIWRRCVHNEESKYLKKKDPHTAMAL